MSLRELAARFPAAASEGRIDAIVLRPARGEPAVHAAQAQAEPGLGLIGDRRSAAGRRAGPDAAKRELTLMQAEHLPLLAGWCGLAAVDPARLRRNLVLSGLNLLAMRSPWPGLRLEWQLGDAVSIELTGPCDPCSQMEAALGPGGYNAMRSHGGMTARIVCGGIVRVGDRVRLKAVHGAGPDRPP